MRILAFSDLHLSAVRARELVAESAKADLVIGAGDFCNGRHGLEEAMALLADIGAPMVVVPGNAESEAELRAAALPGMTVLHGQSHRIAGLRMFGLGYGIPLTPFGSWSCDMTEEAAAKLLDQCEQADLMVFHSPPKGIGDRTSGGFSVGSTAIRAAIERVQPRLAVCGHVHEGWGQRGEIGITKVVNLGPFANMFEIDP